VSKSGEKLGKTAAFKAISQVGEPGSGQAGAGTAPQWWLSATTALSPLQGVESVKKELDESVLGQTGPYRRPERLRKRTEFAGAKFKESKVFEANE
jgi:import inner membrane translocase subunit TIM44